MISVLRFAAVVLLSLGLSAAPALAADVRALVDEVNAERKAKYAEIAQKQGTPIDAVAKIAGQKLIERTPGGQYVLGADGQWRQK